MSWIVIRPEQVIDLFDDPNFRPAERYKDIEAAKGEVGCLVHPATQDVMVRFVIQETVLPARAMVSDHRPRTTMVVPLNGLPEVPELFRPVERPLGLCPFPMKTVSLACMPCPQEPNG